MNETQEDSIPRLEKSLQALQRATEVLQTWPSDSHGQWPPWTGISGSRVPGCSVLDQSSHTQTQKDCPPGNPLFSLPERRQTTHHLPFTEAAFTGSGEIRFLP